MKVVCIVVFTLVSFVCAAQTWRDDWHTESVRGRVKTVYYNYGDFGDEISSLRSAYFDSRQYWYWVDSFSNTGLKLISYQKKNDTVIESFQNEFDSKGRLITATHCVEEEGFSARRVFDYDSKDNLTQIWEHNGNGGFRRYMKYSYKPGLTIEEDSIPGGVEKNIYKYNKNDKLIERTTFMSNGEKFVIKYTNDNNGNLISEIDSFSRTLTTYTYDKYNNIVLVQYSAEDDTAGTYPRTEYRTEYTYDDNGNWTRKIENIPCDILDAPPQYRLTVRKIEYY